MDIVTQGLAGATLALISARPERVRVAAAFGFVAGMAPDLDVLIQSDADPLLYLEYHRQFTHSFAFVPVGSLIVAGLMWLLIGRRLEVPFRQAWLFCAMGMVSHGLLDAATSYGTQLFWPFTDDRFAWSIISIVDPLFSLPVLLLLILAVVFRRRRWSRGALVWVLAYLGLGAIQQQAALDAGRALAEARGHTPVRLDAKPSFANLWVWKTIYEVDDPATGERFYVDAARVGLSPRTFEGASIAKLDVARDFPDLDPSSRQAREIERFRWFSDDFMAQDPERPERVVDVRYSLVPNEIAALWSIEVRPERGREEPVQFLTHRGDAKAGAERLRALLFAP